MKGCILTAAACLCVLSSCSQGGNSGVQRQLDKYSVVHVTSPYFEGISDNGIEVLNLYRFAADEADRIYWDQNFGDASLMEALPDERARAFAKVNYGPWDRIDNKPFVASYGQKPSGANFYPSDMTEGEFEAFDDPAKLSPYTLIRRGEDGALKTVWYHEAYAAHIEKICSYLNAAADITIKPSVREYLLKKIQALRTDDYYESDIAWLDMDDSRMDLIIGPGEALDDELYGVKASYGAYVLLKDLRRTEELAKFSAMVPELQKELPCPEEYRSFVPGESSDIFACDAIYYAGAANAGFKVIAVNLPYDPRVQGEKGSRTILFSNIIRDKFNRTVFPIGTLLLDTDQSSHLDADAFYWNIAFREVSKGLGVKETVNGKGTVTQALGAEALTWEKVKSNVVGVYLACRLIDSHAISSLIQREDALTTFIASLIRSARFGDTEATGRANIMIYNYLTESGAIVRTPSGKYRIDYGQASKAVETLSGIVLKTQAEGDYAFVKDFCDRYSVLGSALKADIRNIELENIPLDIRFKYDWTR